MTPDQKAVLEKVMEAAVKSSYTVKHKDEWLSYINAKQFIAHLCKAMEE